MASNGKLGSIVVICTDGMSNEGVGAMEKARYASDYEKIDSFYKGIGRFA